MSVFILLLCPKLDTVQILVHGEQNNMGRLRGKLSDTYKEREEDVKIHTPRNLETLNLSFRGERVAKVRLPHVSLCQLFS